MNIINNIEYSCIHENIVSWQNKKISTSASLNIYIQLQLFRLWNCESKWLKVQNLPYIHTIQALLWTFVVIIIFVCGNNLWLKALTPNITHTHTCKNYTLIKVEFPRFIFFLLHAILCTKSCMHLKKHLFFGNFPMHSYLFCELSWAQQYFLARFYKQQRQIRLKCR